MTSHIKIFNMHIQVTHILFVIIALGIGKSDGRYPAGGGGGPRRVTPLCPSDYELQPMPVATDMMKWLEHQYPPVVMVLNIKETWSQRPYDILQVDAWLWTLHKRGEVSVTLYSGEPSPENPLYFWIKNFNAYLLIAESGERVAFFLQNEIGFSIKLNDIRLLLNPLAHLLIVVSEINSSHRKYFNSSRMSLKAAWMHHRSIYAIVLTVNEDDIWMRMFADPLHRPSDLAYIDIKPIYSYDTEWSVFKTYPLEANLPPDNISNVVGKRRKDLNLALLPALFVPLTDRTLINDYDFNKKRWKFQEVGDDLRSLFVLSEYLNFQIAETPFNYEMLDLLQHADYIDIILQKTRAYIIMNRFVPNTFKIRRGRFLEESLEMEIFKVVVPRAPPLPLWSLPLRVFEIDIWVGLMGAMVVYAVTWRVVAGESPFACFAAALRAFSSCGGPPQAKITPTSQRLQLAGALLASAVVIAAAYQGRLYTLMTEPEHGEEINSLENLAKSNIPVLRSEKVVASNISEDSFNVALRRHNIRFEDIPVSDTGSIMKYAVKKDYQVAFNIQWSKILPLDILYKRAFERLRCMKDEQTSLFLGLVTNRMNPWHNEINRFLLLCEETGLRIRWIRDARAVNFKHFREQGLDLHDGLQEDKRDIKPFVLRDLTPHFQVLITGLVASVIALGYELYKKGILKEGCQHILHRKRKLKAASKMWNVNVRSTTAGVE